MKHHDYLTGYKATDKNMQCRGFQFELGKWYKVKGDLALCNHGFHFCVHPSGPWNYYADTSTRIFKIEAKDAFEEYEPGSGLKIVCREIKLIEELTPYGDRNTGYGNAGDSNAGDRNAGDRNTGYSNTGDRNAGDRNTGYGNAGDRNAGDHNTGHSNTGDSNATNHSAGFFCQREPCIISFDLQTNLTYANYVKKYPQCRELARKLSSEDTFDYSEFKTLPGWTLKKCKALHQAHIKEKNQ